MVKTALDRRTTNNMRDKREINREINTRPVTGGAPRLVIIHAFNLEYRGILVVCPFPFRSSLITIECARIRAASETKPDTNGTAGRGEEGRGRRRGRISQTYE